MDILLTALSLVAFVGCLLSLTSGNKQLARAHNFADAAETHFVALRSERDRLSTAEREIEALRRELRKLSGKFYATQREANDDAAAAYYDRTDYPPNVFPREIRNGRRAAPEPAGAVTPTQLVCENWLLAQTEGPGSKPSQCECFYCMTERNRRAAEKAAILRERQKPVTGGE